MRHIENWDEIQEQQPGEFERPAPGGYIARIISVEDCEEKEYLRIEWDFAEGPYKGDNSAVFDRAGFWPITLIRSYKPKAMGFFKAFKTSVELSNRGYVFDDQNVQGLAGRYMGIVLGEEEYKKKDGSITVQDYVYQVRTVEAIRKGDFQVPERKRLSSTGTQTVPSSTSAGGFFPVEDDGELPF